MTASEKLNHVLQEIACATGRNPAPSGDGWFNCLCPAHGDTNPSLGVKAMDTRIILNCQAGCDEATVAAAIGMEKKDLFYEPRKQQKKAANTAPTTPLTVEALAADKCLPAPLLTACGVEQDGSIVRIRYRLMDGTDAPRHRKRTGTKGTTGSRWYGTKDDGKPVPYGLWRIHEAHEKRALIIVEGESDCWTLWHHGFPALGIPGATADSCLKPEYFENLDSVYIFSEPDKAGQQFPARVAKRIRKGCPELVIMSFSLPDHKDPNALHQADPANAQRILKDAIRAAAPVPNAEPRSPAPPPADAPRGNRKRDDEPLPEDVADAFCDAYTMAYYNGLYYNWDGKCYRIWPDSYMEAMATQYIRREKFGKPATNFVGNMLLNIRAQSIVSPFIEPPEWLNDAKNINTYIVVDNGILDINELITKGSANALSKHTPDFFTMNALDFAFDIHAECEKWLAFLNEVLPDKELQELMQEWFGYCLIPTQRYQKILMMQGEGANGKSVVCAILKMLVGKQNCAAVGIELLADRFQTSALLNKLVCFSNELGYINSKAEGILKSITGGDTVEVEYKLKDKFSTTLFSRFVITTNNAPRINDRSDGLWRRLIVMPFDVRIPDEKQIPFESMIANLATEMPGILTWALMGLERLKRRGRFIENVKTLEIKDEYKRSSNPARTWIEDNLSAVDDSTRYTVKREAYEAYNKEMKALGLKPHGAPSFGVEVYRWLDSRLPGFRANKNAQRRLDGGVTRVYEGVIMPITGPMKFDDEDVT